MLTIKRLDGDEAQMLIEGAAAKAREIGLPMCIAVTDESGHLLRCERMNGGKISSISIAICPRQSLVACLTGHSN